MVRRKRKKLNYFTREKWIPFILLFIVSLVVLRLVMLQVVQAADLKAKGIQNRTTDSTIYPERGSILDAQGHVLAQSIPVKGVNADPKYLNDMIEDNQIKSSKEEIAEKLAQILETEPQNILDKLNKSDKRWVNLARYVDISKIDKIRELKYSWIVFSDEEKRVYPMDKLCASVLGIVDASGHGAEGIEYFYDNDLYGKTGYKSQELAGAGVIPETLHQIDPPLPGNNLTLTLDSTIQYFVEQTLEELMSTAKCQKATIIAMDPMTGRILGMGSRPTFDPNNYSESTADDRRNLAISMVYEPGSTFKIITGSGALEEGIISPEKRFNDPGFLQIGPRLITNWDSNEKGSHGSPTFTEGMKLSSNVVLAQVGMDMKKERFYTYLKAFGFGTKTGIDIAGEESGLLVPKDKALDIDLATMSFGQANLVTPIQLLTAISAIANGGTLYRPYIVDKITTPDGILIKQNQPYAIRQVVSKTTAAQMTNILEQVVSDGTGRLAMIPGVKVAGKTGTAQKVDPETGGYSSTDFIASFTAFAPVENPKIAVLIILDSPQGNEHQGGVLAAPKAKTLLEGILQYYGVPVAEDAKSTVSVSSDDPAVRPAPKPLVPERTPLGGEVIVPDLTGLTMRQAGEILSKNELHFDFSGSGLVSEQIPASGKVVSKGTIIEVKFSQFAPAS